MIVGSGLAGVYLAYLLTKKGKKEVKIAEPTDRYGGLLASETINGFTFDIGGSHIIFSKDKKILSEMVNFLGDNILRHKRITKIYMNGKYFGYPLESYLFLFDLQKKLRIIKSLLLKRRQSVNNLHEFFVQKFGKVLAEEYFIPYNKKIWKRSLDNLSPEWFFIPGRAPTTDIIEMFLSIVGIGGEGYKEQSTFFYPKQGGIYAFHNSILQQVKKIAKVEEEHITLKRIKEEAEKRKIFSSLPLPLYEKIINDSELMSLLRMLDWNSVLVVGVGIKRKIEPYFHWMYIPEEKYIFHRVANLSNYSSHMAPEGATSLLFEITIPKRKEKPKVKENIIKWLLRQSWIKDESEIVVYKEWFNEFGYVIYDFKRKETVNKIHGILLEYNIVPFGRFGRWEYLNMDGIFKTTKELAGEIK